MDLFNTEFLDICIEGARSKKKTVDSKMNSIMSLMREVEWREKAAKKAKQEVDNCTLDINLEMDELIMAQQNVKESNDKRAKEVHAQRVELATELKELQSCVSGVLNEGDGCVATIDEMCKALEKRLISAVIKKEAADKDKLGKELALAYQKSQMEKLVTESKRLEQEAMENLKLQKFLIDRGHVLNMLQEDISCRCQEVKILKAELEDYQDVTEDYMRPIIQEIPPMHDCEGYKCCNIFKGANGKMAAASREEMGTTKTAKSRINDLEVIQGLAESYMDQLDKGKQARIRPNLKHVYQANQMEKLVEESKILDQQAIENFKLPEFLSLIEMSEDSQDESETSVTEDYLRPTIQERIPMQDCEGYKCSNILEGVNDRVVAGREMRTNKIIKSQINDSQMNHELADSETGQLNKVKWARTGPYLTLAYQESQMEKLVEEAPGLEPEAMENLKLQEFLPIEEMLEDSQDEREISVTEDYMRPIVQETIPRRDCECYNCDKTLEGVKGRVVANREELRTNKTNVKTNDSEDMQELANSYMDQPEKGKRARKVAKRREKTKTFKYSSVHNTKNKVMKKWMREGRSQNHEENHFD